MSDIVEKFEGFKKKLDDRKRKKRDRHQRKSDVRTWLNVRDAGNNIKSAVSTPEYRDGWDRIFGKNDPVINKVAPSTKEGLRE